MRYKSGLLLFSLKYKCVTCSKTDYLTFIMRSFHSDPFRVKSFCASLWEIFFQTVQCPEPKLTPTHGPRNLRFAASIPEVWEEGTAKLLRWNGESWEDWSVVTPHPLQCEQQDRGLCLGNHFEVTLYVYLVKFFKINRITVINVPEGVFWWVLTHHEWVKGVILPDFIVTMRTHMLLKIRRNCFWSPHLIPPYVSACYGTINGKY